MRKGDCHQTGNMHLYNSVGGCPVFVFSLRPNRPARTSPSNRHSPTGSDLKGLLVSLSGQVEVLESQMVGVQIENRPENKECDKLCHWRFASGNSERMRDGKQSPAAATGPLESRFIKCYCTTYIKIWLLVIVGHYFCLCCKEHKKKSENAAVNLHNIV